MKSFFSKKNNEILQKAGEKTIIGMYRVDQGDHLVGINKDSQIGYTQSSKKLSTEDLKLSLKQNPNDYIYTQFFKKPIKLARELEEMKNKQLKEKAEEESAYLTIMANKQVAKTKESYIKINDGKKQT
jgi:hypothetical protein